MHPRTSNRTSNLEAIKIYKNNKDNNKYQDLLSTGYKIDFSEIDSYTLDLAIETITKEDSYRGPRSFQFLPWELYCMAGSPALIQNEDFSNTISEKLYLRSKHGNTVLHLTALSGSTAALEYWLKQIKNMKRPGLAPLNNDGKHWVYYGLLSQSEKMIKYCLNNYTEACKTTLTQHPHLIPKTTIKSAIDTLDDECNDPLKDARNSLRTILEEYIDHLEKSWGLNQAKKIRDIKNLKRLITESTSKTELPGLATSAMKKIKEPRHKLCCLFSPVATSEAGKKACTAIEKHPLLCSLHTLTILEKIYNNLPEETVSDDPKEFPGWTSGLRYG